MLTAIVDYPCTWRGLVDGKPMVDGLEEFGRHVLNTFWRYLQQEVTQRKNLIHSSTFYPSSFEFSSPLVLSALSALVSRFVLT